MCYSEMCKLWGCALEACPDFLTGVAQEGHLPMQGWHVGFGNMSVTLAQWLEVLTCMGMHLQYILTMHIRYLKFNLKDK